MGKVIIGMTTGILWDLHVPHKHVHTKETCHFLDIYKVTDYSDINKPWVSTEEEDPEILYCSPEFCSLQRTSVHVTQQLACLIWSTFFA